MFIEQRKEQWCICVVLCSVPLKAIVLDVIYCVQISLVPLFGLLLERALSNNNNICVNVVDVYSSYIQSMRYVLELVPRFVHV